MKYILDTCVISELAQKKPNDQVVRWVDSLDADDVYLNVITIGEICKGIEKLPDSKRKMDLEVWLGDELLTRFQGHIVQIDLDVMLEWGRLVGRFEKEGIVMPAIDSLIAAMARCGDFILATRNEADFQHAGIRLFNPWKSDIAQAAAADE